jgi:hypothetical protein
MIMEACAWGGTGAYFFFGQRSARGMRGYAMHRLFRVLLGHVIFIHLILHALALSGIWKIDLFI